MEPRDLIVLSPCGAADPSLAIAACRAGACGAFDAEFSTTDTLRRALERLTRFAAGFGVQLRADAPDLLSTALAFQPAVVIFAGADHPALAEGVRAARASGAIVLREAVGVAEAARGVELGADGVVLKGHEAGGRVGPSTSFVLIQQWRQHAARNAVR
ncbi:MAG: hypothetical protein K2V38_24970, partial [Gemmataceae bacterium]|nr:hypothetical protein [Gemmataceae bacterium]